MESLWDTIGPTLLPAAFTLISLVKLVGAYRIRGRGTRVRARVVGQGAAARHASPVAEFFTPDGRRHRVAGNISKSPTRLVPGTMVNVTYDPRDPQRAVIDDEGTGVYWLFLGLGLAGWAVLLIVWTDSWPWGDAPMAFVPLAIGLIFTGIGVGGFVPFRRLRRRGIRAPGVVVGAQQSSSQQGRVTLHHPVVRFPGPDGRPIEAPSGRGTWLRTHRPGTQVAVRYDPANPFRILLDGDRPEPVFWIFGIAGIAVTVIGALVAAAILGLWS